MTVKPANKRDEILLVAAEIFSEKGYRAATLNDVADAMGFTRAALYYYFENKQEILTALMDMAGAEHSANLREHLAADLDVRAKLHRIISSHVLAIIRRPHLFNVFQAEAAELAPAARSRLVEGERGYIDSIARLLVQGAEDRLFIAVPAKPAAMAIVGMANSTSRWFRHGRGLTSSEVAEFIADLALRGLDSR